MKRFTGLFIAALLVLAPLSASALEALTDSAMNDVTGQAGVAISIDDVVIYKQVGTKMYVDSDATGGSLVISADESLTQLNGIKSATGLASALTGAVTDSGTATFAAADAIFQTRNTAFSVASGGTVVQGINGAALTIDVVDKTAQTAIDYAAALGGAGLAYANGDSVVAVVIGVPTLKIEKSVSTKTIGLTTGQDLDELAAEGQKVFGTIITGDSTTALLGGKISIFPNQE